MKTALAACAAASLAASCLRTALAAPTGATSGGVTVYSTPGSAQVYIDDEPRGITSEKGRIVLRGLSAGAHTVRANRDGYREWTKDVSIESGKMLAVRAELEPVSGKPPSAPPPAASPAIAKAYQGMKIGRTYVVESVTKMPGVGMTINATYEYRVQSIDLDALTLTYAVDTAITSSMNGMAMPSSNKSENKTISIKEKPASPPPANGVPQGVMAPYESDVIEVKACVRSNTPQADGQTDLWTCDEKRDLPVRWGDGTRMLPFTFVKSITQSLDPGDKSRYADTTVDQWNSDELPEFAPFLWSHIVSDMKSGASDVTMRLVQVREPR